jgi:hypothetical protein
MKWRNKRFDQWLKERSENNNPSVVIETCLLILPTAAMTSERTTFGKAVLPKLQQK